MSDSAPNRSLWIGLIIIALGTLFLLDNLDIYNFELPYWVFSWQSILIVIGAAMLGSGKRSGLVLILIGAVFLVPEIFHVPRLRFRTWWPLILIVVGLLILFRRGSSGGRRSSGASDYGATSGAESDTDASATDYIDEMSILGGSNKKIRSKAFRGGKITGILGGSEIDLRGSELAPGMHVLDVVTIFGGATLIVPEDWNIRVEINNILGGFGDKRTNIPEDDTSKILVIKGVALLGGGEIKNA